MGIGHYLEAKRKKGLVAYWLSIFFLLFIFFPVILPVCLLIQVCWWSWHKSPEEVMMEEYKKKKEREKDA